MKKFLITGGCGFIGSHLSAHLRKKKFKVIVIDNLIIGRRSLFRGNKLYKIDLNNKKELEKVFRFNEIDSVFHLAGLSKLTESFKKKKLYEKNNINCTKNIIQLIKKYKVKNLIFSSSASVYGKQKRFPITENSILRPISYYGKTKLTCERIIKKNSSSKTFRSISLRFFNVIGSNYKNKLGEIHSPPIHLIPIFIKQILNNKPISIRYGFNTSDSTGERDFVDVGDIVNAHYRCLLKNKNLKKSFNVINLGSKKSFSVMKILKFLKKNLNKKNIKIAKFKKLKGEPDKLLASNDKAYKILGWRPKININISIRNMIKWEKYRITKKTKFY